jgi:3-deoxy-manno-octulosonate cytidylyltransferase (CMP-KDO synthetase)
MIDKKMMKILAVIPARMSATRFPGKPMEKILGVPMIGHCYLRTKLSSLVDEVFVATCDKEIMDYILSIDGDAIMTSDKHERATDRSAEALEKIEKELNTTFDIVVMIQGDEPLIKPEMLDQLTEALINDPKAEVGNLMQKLEGLDEITNPNNVKVVTDLNDMAIYFSREAIPSRSKYSEPFTTYKQLGLIAFRREALLDFIKLTPTNLEIIESVDMNRLIEHNRKIKMLATDIVTAAVDTPEDLVRVNEMMKKDDLLIKYKK